MGIRKKLKGGLMNNKTLIHLSDLHIGLRRKESSRSNEFVSKIKKDYPGIPILITGDLTDSASKRQFKDTRDILADLSQTNPILTVPGNHDYAWKGNILRASGWKNWVKYLGSPLGWGKPQIHWLGVDHEPLGIEGLGVWENGPLVFFGIDSGDPKDKQISARGYISRKLTKALIDSLNKYANKTRIVFLHHHPFSDGFFTKLHGAGMLMKALSNNCELLLFGHDHEYGIWWDKGQIPLTVSSHKSTDAISGDCLMITIIDINKAGTREVSFKHRIEII
jgi:predicted phosphodiesterase